MHVRCFFLFHIMDAVLIEFSDYIRSPENRRPHTYTAEWTNRADERESAASERRRSDKPRTGTRISLIFRRSIANEPSICERARVQSALDEVMLIEAPATLFNAYIRIQRCITHASARDDSAKFRRKCCIPKEIILPVLHYCAIKKYIGKKFK